MTDDADLAQSLVYVRYGNDSAATKDFFVLQPFCKPLETRTTVQLTNIFQVLNAFMQESGLEWKKSVRVCVWMEQEQ